MISRNYRVVVWALCLVFVWPAINPAVRAADCNTNGVDDATDIANGDSPDCNGNGVPEECDLLYQPPEGYTVDFDGANDYMQAPNDPSLEITGDLTIECWIQADAFSVDSRVTQFGDLPETEDVNFLYVVLITTGGDVTVRHEYNGGIDAAVTFDTNLATGKWTHLAVVRDVTAKSYSLYMNGQFFQTLSYSNNPTGGTNGFLRIGANVPNPPSVFFNGRIDEFRIWNDQRTTEEIAGNMFTSVDDTSPNLAGYWRFDEGSGTLANDSTGVNDGTLSGSPAWLAVTHDEDCDVNGVPDDCDIEQGGDCNTNQIVDGCDSAGAATGTLHDNGPLITHPGGGADGADRSAVQTTGDSFGYGVQVPNNNRVADDFVVSGPNARFIESITFYAYETNSGLTSTITHVNLRIWTGPPNDPESEIAFGDTTTNRLASTAWSGVYRTNENDASNTQRPIMTVVATVGALLAPGAYWVDWQLDGDSVLTGPWAVPVMPPPLDSPGNGNALQYTSDSGEWGAADQGNPLFQDDFPFLITAAELDCNTNGILDVCDLGGGAADCNTNDVVDICESDCNTNEIMDACETPSGYALDFDGTDDFVEVANFGGAMPTTEVTVEFWQWIDTLQPHNTFRLDPDQAGNRFSAHTPWTDGMVYWDFGNFQSGGRLSYTPPESIVGSWQHFALVASQSGNDMRIYRNGVLEAWKTGINDFAQGAYTLRIGGGTPGPFDGRLDEFRIWNVARTAEQILDNMNQPLDGDEAGLVAYWRLDEGAGTTAEDSAGSHDGTLVNDPIWLAISQDCNTNGVLDECDIAGGSSADDNSNGIPDECETPECACPGDLTADGQRDADDIQCFVDRLLSGTTSCTSAACADVDQDGDVDAADAGMFVGLLLDSDTACP